MLDGSMSTRHTNVLASAYWTVVGGLECLNTTRESSRLRFPYWTVIGGLECLNI